MINMASITVVAIMEVIINDDNGTVHAYSSLLNLLIFIYNTIVLMSVFLYFICLSIGQSIRQIIW